jgi:hypothetical protein
MSNRKLTILAVAALVMVIWSVVQSRVSNGYKAVSNEPTFLIQGLDTDDIGSIIIGSGDDAVTLKRQGRGFVVVNKDNYPADSSTINDLISKCIGIQTSEFITDKPSNHEDLEVTPDKAKSIIKFMTTDPNSTLLAGVVIGKTTELGQGSYVRLLSNDDSLSNKVYVCDNVPWFQSGAINYIDQELLSLKKDDIDSVIVSSPDGVYTLKRTEGGQDVTLVDDVPAGKKFKTSAGNIVFSALTSLRCDDVKKESGDLDFNRQYICNLKDSTVYTLKIAKDGDKTYVMCESDFTDKTPVEKKSLEQGGMVESQEELKKKEAKLLGQENAIKFTTKHKGWVYTVPSWKAENLTKKLSDLLEDQETPEQPETAEDANSISPVAAPVLPELQQEQAGQDTEEPNSVQVEE